MYYVIQAIHGIKNKHFVSYSAPKYIYSAKNENVIFEFGEKPDIKRKWAAKVDIVLLTKDKEFFLTFLKRLKNTEETYLNKIDEQQKRLDELFAELKEKMDGQFDSIKNDKNTPSLIQEEN